MQEILYLEVPTPDSAAVLHWLHQDYAPAIAPNIQKIITPTGCRLSHPHSESQLAIVIWTLQRTTYLKIFRWGSKPFPQETTLGRSLRQALATSFPLTPKTPPNIDLQQDSIFTALADDYPLTVQYFEKMPNGKADLERVYWWEQRWRQEVLNPQQPRTVITTVEAPRTATNGHELTPSPEYDLIYIGGALGVIHAAVMARLGYRVLLLERLPFGRMNREWNISRDEFQSLIDLGLFTAAEFESVIAREYTDGFNKFFDGNCPPHCQSPVLHTPTVLNVALDSSRFLALCGDKLRQAGGEIWDQTEFQGAQVSPEQVSIEACDRRTGQPRTTTGRLLVDAMGTASPIAWQLNQGQPFNSVCPTVGAIVSGIQPQVWDSTYGDVLYSHGDISRGRQLIWELFPGGGDELTIYLFHYHRIDRQNPGSLLEMYEDFFTILPEYRRCDLDELTWVKPTFGYIPGYFSYHQGDRTVAIDRLVAIGDAASLQSPLVFTGFGSLVRNLPRLTDLLTTALKHDLLDAKHLNKIRAYQSNTAVTWLFSRGMMVPPGKSLPPNRINAMLNTFFGILGQTSPELTDRFIKDRAGWWPFNRMALTAAWQNPGLLYWIWDMVGPGDMVRWLGSYASFTWEAFLHGILGLWVPGIVRSLQPWLEPRAPQLWFSLLAWSYALTYSLGMPRIEQSLPELSNEPQPDPLTRSPVHHR